MEREDIVGRDADAGDADAGVIEEDLDCWIDTKGKEICRTLVGHEEIHGQQVPVFRYWTRKQLDKVIQEQERKLRFEKQGQILPGFRNSILER